MLIINKYKSGLFLNFDNSLDYEKNNKNIKQKINYVYSHRSKFIRSFLFFYSIFLILFPFSICKYSNNPEFRAKANLNFLLLLDNEYSNFYSFL